MDRSFHQPSLKCFPKRGCLKTSSPTYVQSTRKASEGSEFQALFAWRNTTTAGIGNSPAQRLFSWFPCCNPATPQKRTPGSWLPTNNARSSTVTSTASLWSLFLPAIPCGWRYLDRKHGLLAPAWAKQNPGTMPLRRGLPPIDGTADS